MRLVVVSHPCFKAINRRVYVPLMRRGVEVTIIVPRDYRGTLPDPQVPGQPPVLFLPLSSDSPRTYRFMGAESELDRIKPHAVLLEADPVSRSAHELGGWCRRNGSHLMCLSAENLDFGFLPHLKRTGFKSLPQILAKNTLNFSTKLRVDQVFTICSAGTEIFKRRGYRRVTQIPLGFDPALFHVDAEARARVRARHEIDPDAIVLAYFGRVSSQKGIHLIVQALGEIAAANLAPDNWRFLLDQFQPEDAYSRKLIEQIDASGLRSRMVTFEADHQQIAEYMCATDVVVLASLSTPTSVEQYGRVIPEAMACGALAVVSDSGAPKELVGDCGLVFKEGDVRGLKEILRSVIARPDDYRQLREAGTQRMTKLFSMDRQAEIYFETLQELVAA